MVSPFSLGVVIPCHKPYIPYLQECLDSIELQTVRPDRVVVVCSNATPTDIPREYLQYSFPLTILTREDTRHQAQNRNQGVSLLDTTFVSFFDADDIMHPQRIEWILKTIGDSDLLLHGYTMGERAFSCIRAPVVYRNRLLRAPTGCVVFEENWAAPLHHGHATMRRSLFTTFQFDEKNWCSEDTILCGAIVASGVQTVFLPASLSWYRTRP